MQSIGSEHLLSSNSLILEQLKDAVRQLDSSGCGTRQMGKPGNDFQGILLDVRH